MFIRWIERKLTEHRMRQERAERRRALLIEGNAIVDTIRDVRRMGHVSPPSWDQRLDEILAEIQEIGL